MSLEPLPFRLLIDAVMEPARRHFWAMFPAIVLPLGAMAVLTGVSQVDWVRRLESEGGGAEIFLYSLFFFGLVLAFSLVYYLCFVVMILTAQDAVAGRGVDMRRSWLFLIRPENFLTLLLLGAIAFLSVLACGFPALYVLPMLSFAFPAMREEGVSGTRALGRGFELGRYNPRKRFGELPWVQMLGILFISWIISSLLASLVQLPFVVVQQFLSMREILGSGGSVTASVVWLQVPASLAGALATAVSWGYLSFGIAVLYREVRRRKEGLDLEEAVESLLRPGAGADAPTGMGEGGG